MSDINEAASTFERLVSSISDSERKILLEKMHALAGDPSTQELESDEKGVNTDLFSLDDLLKGESLLYRFFLWLRSIFSNANKEDLYNQDQIVALFRKFDHSHPGIIDYKNGYLLSIFYQKLCELKNAIDFFKPYLELAYRDVSAFYVFVGSLICPEVTQQMDSEVNPYSLPLTREVTSELRSSYLRKIENILKNISPQKRSYVYSCITTIEWFNQLSKLPFERFKNFFSQGGVDDYSCKFELISNEINQFSRVLCNGGPIPEEAISALYLYSANKFIPLDSEATDDEGRMKEYMNKATANISMIHMFVKTVPMRQIARIVFNNIQWMPENFTGAEDWFVKYKEQWKKLFDKKWSAWIADKKKALIHTQLTTIFGIEDFPLLENRPWALMWEGIPFHFEYTSGFISWFMERKYAELIQPLKLLLLEGAFDNKENRKEFANTINELSQIYNEIVKLNDDLSKTGQIGLVFDKIAANHLRTLQAQSKIESTMLTIESDFQKIKMSFCNGCRSIKSVVGSALGDRNDTRYDGVSNINNIQGNGNDVFKSQLKNSMVAFEAALEMIKALEPIDIPGVK